MDSSNISNLYSEYISKGEKVYNDLMDICKDPMKCNEELLMEILEDNKDTEYGKKYDFASIKSIEDFQKKVPITIYDDYAGYIYRMTEKCENNLITVYNIDYYARSSGTTGNPKRIPVSTRTVDVFKNISVYYQPYLIAKEVGTDWINQPFLNLVGINKSKLKSGQYYGGVSCKVVECFADNVLDVTTSPIEALYPHPDTDTVYLHVRFALERKNISYTFTTFCSLFLDFIRYMESNWKILVKDIEEGTIDESIKMSNDIKESVLAQIKPNPERAKELREVFEEGFNETLISRLWPSMKCLVGIGTGGFSNYLEKIKNYDDFDCLGITIVKNMSSDVVYNNRINLNNNMISIPLE